MSAAVQTIWAELIAGSLADAGIVTCVVSPGSRSTPLVAALAGEPRLQIATIIDERAAAFYALGAARATGVPAVLVCTSGTAAAHYLPAIIEASLAGVPLVAITADRPPELHGCGASQTIEQVGLYGRFVRGAIDLGPPAGAGGAGGELAVRAVRRKVVQAITLASGPHPGPVHLGVPLRKPLEPARPSTDAERALADLAAGLRGEAIVATPRLTADRAALARLARAIAGESDGVIVGGAMPIGFARAREAVFALAARTGYPVIAEAGSQLRFGPRPDGVVVVDHFDVIPQAALPTPRLVLQLGAEPVAAAWPGWLARTTPERWVLAGHAWHDPDSSAHAVVLGDVADALELLSTFATSGRAVDDVATRSPAPPGPAGLAVATSGRAAWSDEWRAIERAARAATDAAIEAHARSETAVVRAAIEAVPAGAAIQIGNSLPIRVIDHACAGGPPRAVLTQRGAAGIDGLIASAAGATRAGQPVLLVLGDVSFAHDLGSLVAARAAVAPLAILVLDNGGGQIFAGLPIARAELGAAFGEHWLTPPELDPAAVATALGARAITAASPAAAAAAVAAALATAGITVIHAPVSVSGAHDVRRTAIELHAAHEIPTRRTS